MRARYPNKERAGIAPRPFLFPMIGVDQKLTCSEPDTARGEPICTKPGEP
jgi:hypothetical protein